MGREVRKAFRSYPRKWKNENMEPPYYIVCRQNDRTSTWTKFNEYLGRITQVQLRDWRPARRFKFIETAIKFRDKILNKYKFESYELHIVLVNDTQEYAYKMLERGDYMSNAYSFTIFPERLDKKGK